MPTRNQGLGDFGEELVASTVHCPGCKLETRTLRLLPRNFKCADLICDFCGYLAQVKTTEAKRATDLQCPSRILGAAWGPQKARMDAGVYFSLFIVVASADKRRYAIYFLPRDLQQPTMFKMRTPLRETARRAGWQGYVLEVEAALGKPVLIHEKS